LIGGVVLAAGEGRRFGGPKMLAELDGRPLLEHVAAAMAAAPVDRLVCVLGAGAETVRRGVNFESAEIVVCDDWAEGQAASLRTGVEALADAEAIVIALGDQPLLSPAAVERVLAARGEGALAVRATYGGVPSHPTLVERPLFGRLLELRGDAGARDLLAGSPTREVPCDGLGSARDVDTPEDLAALREASEGNAGGEGP
jgi:molybdenum cofactor cytidylyltransferase